MKLIEFLNQSKQKEFWHGSSVVCFKGESYYFLFFSALFDFLGKKELLPATRKNIFITDIDKSKLFASLQQSFLGQTYFYWLGEYTVSSKDKNKLQMLDFLVKYKGPHNIAFFLNTEKLTIKNLSLYKKVDFIEVENKVDKDLFQVFLKFFEYKISSKKLGLIRKLLQTSAVSLDQVCILLQYLGLINDKMVDGFSQYLSSIISKEQPSLFLLSQHFFQRQAEPFFGIWSKLYKDYPDMFWISFWSEQIWKAYNVVKFLREKNFTQARSMSFRLPFTFINRDWKNFSLNELAKLYQFLYNIDFAIKTGSNFDSLDLFYFNHFMKKYCEKR
jgi:hypothetical protein